MAQQESTVFASFSLDARDLTKSAVTTIRVALGIGGTLSLVIGLLITFWPERTAVVLAWMLGIYWVIAGLVYVAVGIFAKGMKTGSRVLDIFLGVLMVVAGVIVASSPSESAMFLGIFLGIYIGILWLIEGIVTLVQSGDAPSRGWAVFFGILSVVAGIVLLTSPLWAIQLVFLLTGIALIVLGIIQLVRAFQFGRGVTTIDEPVAE